MKFIRTASVFAISALLVACGGGGGAASNKSINAEPVTETLVTGSAAGIDNFYFGVSDVNTMTASLAQQAATFSNVNNLNDFRLNDSYGDITSQFTFNTVGVSAAAFHTGSANESGTTYSIGGTTWSYARFGTFHNLVTTGFRQYTIRHTPFFVANVFSPATLRDATYENNGLAVGMFSSEVGTVAFDLKCSVTAAYTQSSQELALTLSSCEYLTNAFGGGTIRLSPAGNSASGFGFLVNYFDNPEVNILSSSYKFAGPTGQELVGAVTLYKNGQVLSFAFGVKKK